MSANASENAKNVKTVKSLKNKDSEANKSVKIVSEKVSENAKNLNTSVILRINKIVNRARRNSTSRNWN